MDDQTNYRITYNNHDLIPYNKFYDDDDYKCIKCGIELYRDGSNIFWIIVRDFFIDEICNISCNEYLIKQIIE